MSMSGEEKATKEIITIAVKDDGVVRVASEGIYLEDDPTLVDEEQHQFRLTVDAKLMTYDPVIDGKVDDIENKLDHGTHGLAALETLVDEVESLLKNATYGLAALETLVDELEPRLVTGLQEGLTLSDHLLAGNIIGNEGFETGDTSEWTGVGAGSWSVQAVTVKYGTYAADVEPNIASNYTVYTTPLTPCYPGRRVRANAYMKADANIDNSYLRIAWHDADRAFIRVTASPDYGGNYDWTFRKVVFTAPDEAYFFKPQIRFRSGGVAGHGYVDAVLVPQAPMDAEIHEYAVHVSEVWPDEPTRTVTVTSGIGADTWGAWANLVDSTAQTLSSKFAASDGYLAAMHIEECDSVDNMYHLELRDNVRGETLNRMRFSKANVRVEVGHVINVRSIRILTGADIEYRMKDATGGKTADLHIRYYLV